MSKLSREDVLKLAQLARLNLEDSEVEEFASEMTAILNYVEQLGTVDVKGLKQTNQITGLTNVTSKDELKDYGYSTDDLQKNLPAATPDKHIKVKRMIG